MSTYNTLGIILKKTDRGEADQLFNIYTKEKGKITALGRATKKITSKLNGNLQQFALINLMIASGKANDHVASAEIVKRYGKITVDLKKIVLGSFALELVDRLTKPGEGEPKIFYLISRYFLALDENLFADSDWQIIRQAFIIKLMVLLGLAPPAHIASDREKLNIFLNNHLDSELNTNKFFIKFSA